MIQIACPAALVGPAHVSENSFRCPNCLKKFRLNRQLRPDAPKPTPTRRKALRWSTATAACGGAVILLAATIILIIHRPLKNDSNAKSEDRNDSPGFSLTDPNKSLRWLISISHDAYYTETANNLLAEDRKQACSIQLNKLHGKQINWPMPVSSVNEKGLFLEGISAIGDNISLGVALKSPKVDNFLRLGLSPPDPDTNETILSHGNTKWARKLEKGDMLTLTATIECVKHSYYGESHCFIIYVDPTLYSLLPIRK